jgi:hypothetical protein
VRVTQEQQKLAPAKPAPVASGRTEPIFYNGKTYTLKFAQAKGGDFSMAVLGMSGGQKKDAIAVATSSLRYFKCKDGQNGVLTSGPTYSSDAWNMTVKCS